MTEKQTKERPAPQENEAEEKGGNPECGTKIEDDRAPSSPIDRLAEVIEVTQQQLQALTKVLLERAEVPMKTLESENTTAELTQDGLVFKGGQKPFIWRWSAFKAICGTLALIVAFVGGWLISTRVQFTGVERDIKHNVELVQNQTKTFDTIVKKGLQIASLRLEKAVDKQVSKSVQAHSVAIKSRVNKQSKRLEKLKQDVAGVKQDVAGVKQDVAGVKQKVQSIDNKLDQLIRFMQRKK